MQQFKEFLWQLSLNPKSHTSKDDEDLCAYFERWFFYICYLMDDDKYLEYHKWENWIYYLLYPMTPWSFFEKFFPTPEDN